MKCLGALDGFIALAFILEACILGFFGGLLGALVGLTIAMSRMFGTFGSLLAGAVPTPSLLLAVGAALFLGVILAAFSTLIPALQAARLAPMKAMRVE
jgi:putative ABC transport system permease protein